MRTSLKRNISERKNVESLLPYFKIASIPPRASLKSLNGGGKLWEFHCDIYRHLIDKLLVDVPSRSNQSRNMLRKRKNISCVRRKLVIHYG